MTRTPSHKADSLRAQEADDRFITHTCCGLKGVCSKTLHYLPLHHTVTLPPAALISLGSSKGHHVWSGFALSLSLSLSQHTHTHSQENMKKKKLKYTHKEQNIKSMV